MKLTNVPLPDVADQIHGLTVVFGVLNQSGQTAKRNGTATHRLTELDITPCSDGELSTFYRAITQARYRTEHFGVLLTW